MENKELANIKFPADLVVILKDLKKELKLKSVGQALKHIVDFYKADKENQTLTAENDTIISLQQEILTKTTEIRDLFLTERDAHLKSLLDASLKVKRIDEDDEEYQMYA